MCLDSKLASAMLMMRLLQEATSASAEAEVTEDPVATEVAEVRHTHCMYQSFRRHNILHVGCQQQCCRRGRCCSGTI